MFRPTPGRLFYLLIGLVIGAIGLFAYVSVAGTPTFLPVIGGAASQPKPTAQFSGTSLSKVFLANQQAVKGGATMRINSVENYADGFSFTYSIVSGQPGEPAPVLQAERFDVSDDKGGVYHLSQLGSTTTPGPGLTMGYLTFTPALNPSATALTVSVPHLLVVSNVSSLGSPAVLDGPWQVAIPLK
jgi:hypothetical protein